MISKQFIIDFDDYIGDFDLNLTMYSGQTSQPPWKCVDNKFYEIIVVDGVNVLVELSQDKLNDSLVVCYHALEDVDEEKLRNKLFYIFDLDYDMDKLYNYLEDNEELNNVYSFNKGLRLFKAQFPYESIISSICSANNSIKRWTKSINDIRCCCGEKITFSNDSYYIFPKEEDFLNMSMTDLKDCGVGYRNKYMLNSTQKLLDNDKFHEYIFNSSYDNAYKKIIELDGVGPKVADCILLYGYGKYESFPVDVWINRITSYMYFKNQKPSNKKITSFAQDKFGTCSGYIQLYLFNYARLSGLMDQLKSFKN